MKCEKMEELISAFVDGETDARETAVVERHLKDCRACRLQAKRLAELKGAVRRAAAAPAPDDLKDALFAAAGRRRAAAVPPAAPVFPLARWGMAVAFAAGAGAIMLVARPKEEVVPVDFMLAAHDSYALTMPLAPAEELTPELVERLAEGGGL